MKKLFTLLLSSLAIGSFGQVVVYDIKPADFVSPFLELTSGDICSGSVEEAKQQSMGNTWGFTWTSTNSGTPASIQIDMYYTISDGGTAYATTLNSTASGTVDNVSAFSCTGASISS